MLPRPLGEHGEAYADIKRLVDGGDLGVLQQGRGGGTKRHVGDRSPY